MLNREQEIEIIVRGMRDRQPGETDEELAGRVIDDFARTNAGSAEAGWKDRALAAEERERDLRDDRVRTAHFHVAHDGEVRHPDGCNGCRAVAERGRRAETPK